MTPDPMSFGLGKLSTAVWQRDSKWVECLDPCDVTGVSLRMHMGQ